MCVVTLKPSVHRIITNRLGIALAMLAAPDALLRDEIPPASQGYFCPLDAGQRPSAYSIDPAAGHSALSRLVSAATVTMTPEISGTPAAA
jgi:hypothetical protein